MKETKVLVEHHDRRVDRQGRLYRTLALRWKRPSGDWATVGFGNVLFPEELTGIVTTRVAFPLDDHLQGGGDADEAAVRAALEIVIRQAPSRPNEEADVLQRP